MNNLFLNIYKISGHESKEVHSNSNHPDGTRLLLDIYKDKIATIGFNDKGNGNLRLFHNHCIEIFKESIFEQVELKPLLDVITLWLYLGFEFKRRQEYNNFIISLIDWIDENNISFDIDTINNLETTILIQKLKNDIIEFEFPNFLNSNNYYVSTLYKDTV
jgi:hypothetical protein